MELLTLLLLVASIFTGSTGIYIGQVTVSPSPIATVLEGNNLTFTCSGSIYSWPKVSTNQ